MKQSIQLATCAALVVASSFTFAATDTASTTRQQRIDSALQNYRSGSSTSGTSTMSGTSASSGRSTNSGAGPVARTEETVKRVSRKTGHAIASGARTGGHVVASGARKGGHVVAEAARKTGSAIRRTGEKMGGSSTPTNNGNDSHVGK